MEVAQVLGDDSIPYDLVCDSGLFFVWWLGVGSDIARGYLYVWTNLAGSTRKPSTRLGLSNTWSEQVCSLTRPDPSDPPTHPDGFTGLVLLFCFPNLNLKKQIVGFEHGT